MAQGLWRHREVIDGTYTLQDLFDAHELLDTMAHNEREHAEYSRRQNAQRS